jgi:hypothetical protein
MAKSRTTKPNDAEQGVLLRQKDAQRVFNVVHWYENTSRPRRPSKLPRAPGGGGGSSIRLGQFTDTWANEPGQSGDANLKKVTLYMQDAQNAAGPNDWGPEITDGSQTIVVAINLFSYIPTRSGGDTRRWCAVTPLTSASGTFQGQDYDRLWLLLAAEC